MYKKELLENSLSVDQFKIKVAEIYISGGCGSAVRMDVKSSKRNRSDINYTVTTNFEHDSIKNSLDTALDMFKKHIFSWIHMQG